MNNLLMLNLIELCNYLNYKFICKAWGIFEYIFFELEFSFTIDIFQIPQCWFPSFRFIYTRKIPSVILFNSKLYKRSYTLRLMTSNLITPFKEHTKKNNTTKLINNCAQLYPPSKRFCLRFLPLLFISYIKTFRPTTSCNSDNGWEFE